MENEFVCWVRSQFAQNESVERGPGDDAAILRLSGQQGTVVTTDTLMDGVDFLVDQVDACRIGHKALAVSLSDLAAMAARPVAAFVSLVLPRRGGRQLAEGLYAGMAPLAERYGVAIAGGDTNSWDGPLVITITAIGQTTADGPLLRSGGQVGDAVLVTGHFGGSILNKHLDFEPRVAEALLLNSRYDLHAGMDVSDGLTLDLSRLCQESQLGTLLNLEAIPISDAAGELARQQPNSKTPLDHALGDGEDFELIVTLPASEAKRLLADQPLGIPVTRIGTLVAEQGLWALNADGKRKPIAADGYQHEIDP